MRSPPVVARTFAATAVYKHRDAPENQIKFDFDATLCDAKRTLTGFNISLIWRVDARRSASMRLVWTGLYVLIRCFEQWRLLFPDRSVVRGYYKVMAGVCLSVCPSVRLPVCLSRTCLDLTRKRKGLRSPKLAGYESPSHDPWTYLEVKGQGHQAD